MTLLDQTPGAGASPAPTGAGVTEIRPAEETFVYVSPDDPRALPLLRDLEREYDARYGDVFEEPASVEINRYPASEFSAPRGAFVLLLRDGIAIAGGAFKTLDDHTTELKRIWTAADHRRRGLARRVVLELEDESRRRGFTRSYLTTGPRQPEAVLLYRSAGWTPLFDEGIPPERIGIHGFAKSLTAEPLDVADIRARHEAEHAPPGASAPESRPAPKPAPAPTSTPTPAPASNGSSS
ncbi:GNAT family N-acetyltransferase [Mycetocola saprophilus]|uniref:GNAT family N-acetyltransferase n=1 Tax=Mycetocola saprophilus TaxID=76636 RepID=UPI003BEF957C